MPHCIYIKYDPPDTVTLFTLPKHYPGTRYPISNKTPMIRITLGLSLTTTAITQNVLGIIYLDAAHIISRTRAAVQRPGVVGRTRVSSISAIGGTAVKTRTVFFQEQAGEVSY